MWSLTMVRHWIFPRAPFLKFPPVTMLGWSAMSLGSPSNGPAPVLSGSPGFSKRVLATVLFTDIVDSTATLQRMGNTKWRDALRTHNTRLRDQLNAYRGREVKTTGDGFLAVFDSPTQAVRCAAGMALAARAMGLPIRVGVHTGEVEFIGSDARGLAVHVAARVMSLAGPDEVTISSTTHALLEGSGLHFEDLGMHELKGLPGPRQVHRLITAALGSDDNPVIGS
ncbi:MAG: adenylate/guanylate cyclase domain-containing protein [Acidimicrobiia bacterium]